MDSCLLRGILTKKILLQIHLKFQSLRQIAPYPRPGGLPLPFIGSEAPLWLHFLYWLLKATSIPKMQFQSQVFVFACNTTYWDGTSLQSCFILRKVSYKNQCCYNNNIHNQVSMQLLQQYINKSQILKDKSVPKTLALILCIEIVYAYITIPFQVKKCFQT